MTVATKKSAEPTMTDDEPVLVLTQEEAHERFPSRGYDQYDPMTLICGTRKSIMRDVKMQLKIGEQILPLGEQLGLNGYYVEQGFSVDVDKAKSDVRIVVWKQNR